MGQEPEDAEALRRRLYRPGASAADLATYLHVAEVDEPAVAAAVVTTVDPGPSIRPFVIGAACVAAAALLGGVLLSGGLSATPAATAAPTIAVTDDADGSTWRTTFSADVTGHFVQAVVLDSGERAHAHGTSVAEGPDRYRYTVASGDTVAAIARRFELCSTDVIVALPYGFSAADLPAGSTLELGHATTAGQQEFHNGTC